MANSLTPLSPTFWSAIMGTKLYKENVGIPLTSRKEEASLKYGQTVDRPYRADIRVQKYTKGSALTAQDITAVSDTLTVDKSFGMLIYVDSIDKIQNKWDAAEAWSAEATTRLSNQIDADIFYQGATLAGATIDYNDLDSNQTAGDGIVLTVANILKLFTVTKRKLTANNVPNANRFIVISPEVEEILMTFLSGKESILGDKSGESGMIGRYMGLDIYVSNNLTGYVRWTPTDNPASAETLVVEGITFTFIDTIGTTEGNVLQTTNTETTLTNLAHLINNNTTTANHVAFAATVASKDAIEANWVAVSTATYIDIWVKGANSLTVTDTADATVTYLKQLCLAGEKKAIDLVIQKNPSVKMASTVSAGKDGMNILPLALWGCDVFHDMAARLFSIEIDSTNY
jgi:hypothetical protein